MLASLSRWLARPLSEEIPEGRGAWDEVLRALHRHERDAARNAASLSDTLARLRRAAQALPDGVMILDAENRIEWCNDTAAAHLGLDPHADLRRPITNLLREPAFVKYLADPDEGKPLHVGGAGDATLTLKLIPYGQAQKLLLSRDVTQVERVETMRRDFVANVS